MTNLYYEAHITVEPVFDEELDRMKSLVRQHGFRVADLLMKKRVADTPTRSAYDTFCTARSENYDDIYSRTLNCVKLLGENGFRVWRYKIEDTLLDVRDPLHFELTPARKEVIDRLAATGTPVRVDAGRKL